MREPLRPPSAKSAAVHDCGGQRFLEGLLVSVARDQLRLRTFTHCRFSPLYISAASWPRRRLCCLVKCLFTKAGTSGMMNTSLLKPAPVYVCRSSFLGLDDEQQHRVACNMQQSAAYLVYIDVN